MELSPSRLGRVANSSLGVIPAVASVAYGAQAAAVYPRLAACVALLASVVIAVRGYRLGVTCQNAEVTVR